MRVKQIVVVPDHHIRKKTHIQSQLKRTDPVGSGTVLYHLSVKIVQIGQQLVNRIIHPVKMSFGIRTKVRIALSFPHKANFVLGSQCDGFTLKPLFPHQSKRILRHRSGDCLGRQIKYPLPQPLPHGLDRRKQGRNGFAHTGGRLDEQLSSVVDCLIHIGSQLLLPLPVGKRKLQLFNGSSSLSLPLKSEIRPLPILPDYILKPLCQLFHKIFEIKVSDLLRVHITIGKPYPHLIKLMLTSVNICIASGLCQMYRNRTFHFSHIAVSALDLIDGGKLFPFPGNNPIRPSLNTNIIIGGLINIFKGNLRLIICPHAALNHAVNPSALLHGRFTESNSSVVYISGTQYKFHKLPDRYPYLHLTHLTSYVWLTKTPCKDSTLSLSGSQLILLHNSRCERLPGREQ